MSELKKCPFCGAEAAYAQILGNYERPHEVYCSGCDGGITEGRSKDGVIHNWNNRPIEDALNTRIIEVTNLYLQTKDAFNLATEILLKQDARITELEAAQRWIPVSERLPENGKVVHVIDMNDTGGHLCNLYGTAMLVEVSGNKRFGFIGHCGWDTSDVTHWMYAMPLPQPPEVQE